MGERRGICLALCMGLALLGGGSSAVLASGFALYEQNASGVGAAFAGVSASVEDASIVFWNPAGMARLKPGKHFAIAAHSINPHTSFSNGASVAGINRNDFGSSGGNVGESALIPNGYFAMDLDRSWSFGVGINVPFGLATEYDANWVGRFQGIRSEIKTLNINPAFSWKATDALALGFGVNYMQGEIDLLTGVNYKGLVFGTALNPAVAVNAEGQSKVALEGSGWGFNAGLIYDLNTATRIGIAYRSRVKQKLGGTVTFTGVPAAYAASAALTAATANGDVSLTVNTPDTVSISVSHALSSNWNLLGDMTWTGWGVVKALPLRRSSGATLDTLTFNFRDTMRYSAGAHYRMSDTWTLKFGVAYDQTPVPNADSRSVRLPDNDRIWFSAGAKYRVSGSGSIDAGFAHIRAKDARISNNQNVGNVRGNIDGTYQGTVNIVSLQYSHAF